MSESTEIRLVLTGPLEGQSLRTAHGNYTNGVMKLEGKPSELAGMIKYHKVCYQAEVEGPAISFENTIEPIVTVMLEIQGPKAGESFVTANGYQFKEGRMELEGTASDVEGIMKYMETCYQAYPVKEEDSGKRNVSEKVVEDEQPEVQPEVQQDTGQDPSEEAGEGEGSDEAEAGDSGVRAEGDGDSSRLVSVIHDLDPRNESHWTKSGMPSLAAVRMLSGDESVTREDIERAAPGHCRR